MNSGAKMKRKLIALLILTFLFVGNNLYSDVLNTAQNQKLLNVQQNVLPPNVAYQIIKQGKQLSDGSYEPDKIYNIERTSSQNYLPNTLYIKTKYNAGVSKDSKNFNLPGLQTAFAGIKIKIISAPFADKGNDAIQSADPTGVNRIYEITYDGNDDPYDVCAELVNNPEIEYAVPVFIRHPFFTPNDPQFSSQWALTKIGMQAAWTISMGDPNVVIGIVDTGTDWMHEDLNANIWINPGEDGLDKNGNSKRTNGIDDDGDGKIDDWHGWDFVGNISLTDLYQGVLMPDNDPANIQLFHGTHVAGCASAVTNNGKGIASPGFKCKLLPVKCSPDNANVSQSILTGFDGIKYAADIGCKVINCSWGGPVYSPAEQDIINYAYSKGAVVVVAAGNGNGFNIDQGGQYPAAYDHVLCVGATTSADKVAGFSNIGRRVHVYSPGSGIMATLPNNAYGNLDGTSMASPITAGVAALVFSVHPEWTPKQVIHQIRSTSDNVLTSDPNLRSYYYGRLNAANALLYNNGGSQSVPGVEIESYSIDGKPAINDGTVTQVNLKITNFLSTASRLTLNFSPLSSYLTIQNDAISVGTLGSMQSFNAALQVQLNPNNPWYNGTADILVTFTADNYTDYQIIRVPIVISSNNLYTRVNFFSDEQTPLWSDAMATSQTNFWAVGSGGLFGNGSGYLKRTNGGTSVTSFQGDMIYSIFAFDENRVFLGSGPKSGSAKIYSTLNGGSSAWNGVDVSSITGFVNGINFFDTNNGIFLGDPKNNKWGIGFTTNNGQTWTAKNAPAPLTQETGLVGSTYWHGDKGWFGTTLGRVFRTTDRGTTWFAGAINKALNVSSVVFKDDYNGLAVYSESTQSNADRIIAMTTDKGATWTANVFNMSQNGHYPVHLFYPDSSSMIYALCSMGEVLGTSDMGKTWYPVLTEKEALMETGSHIILGENRARLWEIGKTVGYLDFSYMPQFVNRDLALMSGDTLNFDTLDIGSSILSNIMIQNNGNVDINVFSAIFIYASGVDSSEYQLFGIPPSFISPATSKKFRIRFTPDKVGLRTAMFYINTDGSPDQIGVQLIGYGRIPAGVDDGISTANSIINEIRPNPCTIETFVSFKLSGNYFVEMNLYNSLGNKIRTVFNGIADTDGNLVRINTNDLPSGVYYLRLQSGRTFAGKKFVVIK